MIRYGTCGMLLGMALLSPFGFAQEWVGITVTPHESSSEMRWRRPADPGLAARVEVFLQNQSDEPVTLSGDMTFDGQTAGHWVEQGEWAWHDTPALWADGQVELLVRKGLEKVDCGAAEVVARVQAALAAQRS